MATKLGVDGVTFKQLWNSFDTGKPCANPNFINQCAIRLSDTLLKNGFTLKSFKGVFCYGDSSPYAGKHIIRAREMANWLRNIPIPGMGQTVEVSSPSDYRSELDGKTGIIYFKGYYNNRSGDHIDLWNKSRTTAYWFGWIRELLEELRDDTSHRDSSTEIWFWEIL